MVNDRNVETKGVGHQMNRTKTKVLFNRYTTPKQNITIDNFILEPVKKIIYLGQIVTMSPDKELGIQRRIALGWQALGRAKSVFSSKLPLSLKRKVYNEYISLEITYAAKILNLTKKQQLATIQRSHEKKIIGIIWKDKKQQNG